MTGWTAIGILSVNIIGLALAAAAFYWLNQRRTRASLLVVAVTTAVLGSVMLVAQISVPVPILADWRWRSDEFRILYESSSEAKSAGYKHGAAEIIGAATSCNLVGGDVVEVAPRYDSTTNTAQPGDQMFFEIFAVLAIANSSPSIA
jgi:hypothetical protein